ncbi:dihydrofolate reductase family protein [Glutamicibacter sp.]|uniref:dihydrofolate reductase family protein n=1 Tax=Glutamicibacter sp. TaxID=1931995 RepID=UPI002B491421|nr:dihydrofolate reductase family protein [Glutamicibacter sp.]HJX79539.1 dihydrofolate reductase family protein [Glutamicibacter sp.]
MDSIHHWAEFMMARKLVYYVAVSLDGYIAAPNGDPSGFPIEGDHMEVVLREYGDAVPSHVQKALGLTAPRTKFDSVIMGWNTYNPESNGGLDSPYAHLHQIVASKNSRSVPDNVELTHDPLAKIRELKHETGLDIYLCGGGELAGELLPEIDQLVLKRNPLVFGSGIPLFGSLRYQPVEFIHVRTRTFDSGVSITEYDCAH